MQYCYFAQPIDYVVVLELLQLCVPDKAGVCGQTVLHLACCNQYVTESVLQMLVDNGAQPS
jgi:hypothetical protein